MGVQPTLKFTKDCLAAPANQPFTIHLVNNDKVFAGSAQHNIAIYTNPTASHNVFIGKGIPPNEKVTYHVKGLPRGIYYFKCTVHPVMNGTFVSD
jgi:plastocyanin